MRPLSFLKGPHLSKALVAFAVLPRGCPVLLAAKSSPKGKCEHGGLAQGSNPRGLSAGTASRQPS